MASLIVKPDTIVKTVNLYMSFGNVFVLNRASLCLERGLVYNLQWGDSSGKTTLISIMSSFFCPHQRNIEFEGQTIAHFSPFKSISWTNARSFHNLYLNDV